MLIGIEMEEMPKECHECRFQMKYKDGEQDDWYCRRCVIEDRIIEYPKPKWCPLKNLSVAGH